MHLPVLSCWPPWWAATRAGSPLGPRPFGRPKPLASGGDWVRDGWLLAVYAAADGRYPSAVRAPAGGRDHARLRAVAPGRPAAHRRAGRRAHRGPLWGAG